MRKIVLAALAALVLVPALATAKEKVVRFRGAYVVDEDLGISVAGDEKEKLVAVLSPRYRYGLVLPYAKDWEFSREEHALLRGHSGLWNLTLAAWKTDEKPEDHLAEKKKLLETTPAGKGVKKLEVVPWKGARVLRDEVDGGAFDPKFKGVTVVHYFATKAAKGVLYELHLSVVVDPKHRDAFVDRDWMNYAAVGFRVGDLD